MHNRSPKIARSTKPAPPSFWLAAGTGRHRPSPAPGGLFPHPLQNRVPRGERAPVALCCEPTEPTGETKSFCPCQKSQVSLLRYLTFSLVCGRIWQRGAAAGPPAVRVVGACSPVGCVQAPVSAPASVGAERSPPGSSTRGGRRDKSFCPSNAVFEVGSPLDTEEKKRFQKGGSGLSPANCARRTAERSACPAHSRKSLQPLS